MSFTNNDLISITELFDRHLAHMAAFLNKRGVTQQEDRDDLIQNTWLGYLKYIDSGKTVNNPKSLLFSILNNEWCDYIRDKKKEQDIFISPKNDMPCYRYLSETPCLIEIQRREEREQKLLMDYLLNQLPEDENKLITQKYIEGKSYKELSKYYDKSVSALTKQVERVKLKINKEYDQILLIANI